VIVNNRCQSLRSVACYDETKASSRGAAPCHERYSGPTPKRLGSARHRVQRSVFGTSRVTANVWNAWGRARQRPRALYRSVGSAGDSTINRATRVGHARRGCQRGRRATVVARDAQGEDSRLRSIEPENWAEPIRAAGKAAKARWVAQTGSPKRWKSDVNFTELRDDTGQRLGDLVAFRQGS
jgi:hypothetical protein